MIPFLISFLYLILYVVIAIIVVEVVLWILGQCFGPIPDKIRKLCYAIVGLFFLIGVISMLAGGWHPALYGPAYH
jgi:hypothetical protein